MATQAPDNRWKSRLNFAVRLAAVLILGAFLVLSDEQRSAIARVLRDPMAVLAGRSPGDRGDAALRQTKIRKQLAKADIAKLLDQQEVVSPEELAPDDDLFADLDTPQADDITAPTEVAGRGELADAGTPPAGNHPWTGGFSHVVPGGDVTGGGGGGKGNDCVKGDDACATPTGEPGPPIVAVPEPSTWLLIIAGFFALGGLLRFARQSLGRTAQPHVD